MLLSKITRAVKAFIAIPKSIYLILNKVTLIDHNIHYLQQRMDDLQLNFINNKEPSIFSCQAPIGKDVCSVSRRVNDICENYFFQIESLLSIYNSLPNLKYLPPTRGWAGSPDFLNKIVELILKKKPRFVLEISSGVSSIVIGLALKINKFGKALSLEHDMLYSEITNENLQFNNIEDVLTISNCLMADYLVEGETWKWYAIDGLIITDKIDLVIVDGPPRITQNLARYPVVPILYEYFSDNFIILLDDANRSDEIVIIQKWVEFFEKKGCKVIVEHNLNYEKGFAKLVVKKINI